MNFDCVLISYKTLNVVCLRDFLHYDMFRSVFGIPKPTLFMSNAMLVESQVSKVCGKVRSSRYTLNCLF